MMHVSPVSDSSSVLKYFTVCTCAHFRNFLPKRKNTCSLFHPQKFLMTFLVIESECICSPIFGKTLHFPIFQIFYPPYFGKVPFDFGEFTCFSHALSVFPFQPTLTMKHLCIIHSRTGPVWTPLVACLQSMSRYG